RHRKESYRNPDNPSGSPTVRYYYDALDRVNGVLDPLNQPTNWEYNDRGQVTATTLATDPNDGIRHTISNAYNPDGTLQRRTDQLGHRTDYTYDDYRRGQNITKPLGGVYDNRITLSSSYT